MTFKIEFDHEPPTNRGRRGLAKSLRQLNQAPIGASMFVPDGSCAPGTLGRVIYSIVGPGVMATRKQDGGYRVWKIADQIKRTVS